MPEAILTDFGLAKAAATGSKFTRTGVALGTPAYMAPEQARGEVSALTPAADVWSVGCVLYELLAGRPPFEGESAAAVIGRVLTVDPPSLRAVRPDLPRAAADLVHATLARDPRHRPADARALRDDLDRLLRGERPRARPTGGRRQRSAALAMAAAVAAAIGLWGWHRASPGPAVAAPVASTEAERLAAAAWESRLTDLEQAVARMARAVELAPGRADHRLRLGLLRWARGDPGGALSAWHEIPPRAAEASRAAWLIGLAWCVRRLDERREGGVAEARKAWGRAVSGGPPEADWARAGLAFVARDFAAARRVLEGASHWEAALLLGILETSADDGRPVVAIAAYTRVLEEGLPFLWVRTNRANMRQRLGDLDGASADYQAALAADPDNLEALVGHAGILEFRDALDDAAAHIARALARWPRCVVAFVLRARIHQARGALDEALADLNTALELQPGGTDALYYRADLRRVTGDYAGAMADLDLMLRNESAPQARHLRAWVRRLAGDHAGAIADADGLIAQGALVDLARFERAMALRQSGDIPAALAEFDRLCTEAPADLRARFHRGLVRRSVTDHAGARADFDAVLAADPDHLEALANRGLVRAALGDATGAEADLAAALARAPPDWRARPHAEAALARLRAGESLR